VHIRKQLLRKYPNLIYNSGVVLRKLSVSYFVKNCLQQNDFNGCPVHFIYVCG
jgi:hypothetical protein